MNIIKEIKLDLSQETVQEYIFAKCGDSKSRYLSVALLDQGKPFSIPAGTKARMQVRIQNRAQSVSDCKIEGNKVIAELTQGILSASGKAEAEIVLQSASGEILSTELFFLNIQSYSIDAGKITGSDEYSALTKALVQVDQAGEIAQTAKVNAEEALRNLALLHVAPENFAVKKTVSGNPIRISDGSIWRPQEIVIDGKLEQKESEQGKNLFDIHKYDLPVTISGVTHTINPDGSVTIQGKATANVYWGLGTTNVLPKLTLGKTYRCSAMGARISYNDGTPVAYTNPFTVTANMTEIHLYYQTDKDVSRNMTIYPMLVEGTQQVEYQPFIPNRPSPEYPAEVVSHKEIKIGITKGMPIRYVEDTLNKNSENSGGHWVECKVFVNGKNIAKGIVPSANFTPVADSASLDSYTNEKIGTTASYLITASGADGKDKSLTLDLGKIYYDVEEIKIWHYWNPTTQRYYNHKLRVSSDGVNWSTLFDSFVDGPYVETAEGKSYVFNVDSIYAKLNGPLLSLPDGTCDKLYLDFIRQRAWRVNKACLHILEGNESISKAEAAPGHMCFTIDWSNLALPETEYDLPNIYCTHLKQVSRYMQYNTLTADNVSVFRTTSQISLYFKAFQNWTVAQFKTWLAEQKAAGTPLQLVFQRKTSEIIEIPWDPNWDDLKLHYKNNIVFASSESNLQLTYCADTQLYIDDQIEQRFRGTE